MVQVGGECIGGDRRSWLARGIVDKDKASRDRPCADASYMVPDKGGFEGRDEATTCVIHPHACARG